VKRKVSGFAPGVADQLLRYHWPGNVRELENAMERAVALAAKGRVELEDLPEEIRQAFHDPRPSNGTAQTLGEVEKEFILATLALHGGNKSRTVQQLDISLVTLYRKLKSFGMIGAERKTRRGGQPAGEPVVPA
jgi:DNA-binding NtrC family response regulator